MAEADVDLRLIGDSPAIRDLRNRIDQAAATDLPVLIEGERGSGRSLVAAVLHAKSKRSTGRLVTVNLAAIVAPLATAELFGYERGAFTDAKAMRAGIIEEAHGGSLILDELEQGSDEVKRILSAFLETSTLRRLGSTRSRHLDIRVIGISTIDPAQRVTNPATRDLYSRIGAIVLRVPPLRDRRSDIPVLIEHIIQSRVADAPVSPTIDSSALDALMEYPFPGNVRELSSLITSALVFARDGRITRDQIEPRLRISEDDRRDSTLQSELSAARTEILRLRSNSIVASPIWQGRGFPIERDYAFVLMPFAETNDLQAVYRNHVAPVITRCGLRCERADDIYDVSGVMQSVWEGINRARLIIADLTERNPNVFYELGIAHTLGKSVIMITQSIDYVPFDLRHLRCIVYEYKPAAIARFEDALTRTVRTVLSSGTFGPDVLQPSASTLT
jgi:hypothetical protein